MYLLAVNLFGSLPVRIVRLPSFHDGIPSSLPSSGKIAIDLKECLPKLLNYIIFFVSNFTVLGVFGPVYLSLAPRDWCIVINHDADGLDIQDKQAQSTNHSTLKLRFSIMLSLINLINILKNQNSFLSRIYRQSWLLTQIVLRVKIFWKHFQIVSSQICSGCVDFLFVSRIWKSYISACETVGRYGSRAGRNVSLW